MADDQGTTSPEQTDEATPITIASVDDVAGFVEALAQDGVSGPTARSFTAKAGFRSIQPLLNTDPQILAAMAGSISYALAEQAANGEEGASDALNISIEYAQNVTTLKANMVKLRSYCEVALNVGYGTVIDKEDADIDDLTVNEMAKIVSAFLDAQKKQKSDPESVAFKEWTDATAAA